MYHHDNVSHTDHDAPCAVVSHRCSTSDEKWFISRSSWHSERTRSPHHDAEKFPAPTQHSFELFEQHFVPFAQRLLKIWENNALPMPQRWLQRYNTIKDFSIQTAQLCPRIARFNHSCRPNAMYDWRLSHGEKLISSGVEEVVATGPIKCGEEICVNYLGAQCCTLSTTL